MAQTSHPRVNPSLTRQRETGAMKPTARPWPTPRLTTFAWWWLATRVALPLLATTLALDLAVG